MPFQSEKQRRYLHANHPEIAKRWEREYATGGISNHFRRKFFTGALADTQGPAGGQAMSPGTSTTGGTRHGGGGGGNGGTHPIHTGPTAAELAARKAAAAAAALEKKKLAEWEHTQAINKTKTDRAKKTKYLKGLLKNDPLYETYVDKGLLDWDNIKSYESETDSAKLAKQKNRWGYTNAFGLGNPNLYIADIEKFQPEWTPGATQEGRLNKRIAEVIGHEARHQVLGEGHFEIDPYSQKINEDLMAQGFVEEENFNLPDPGTHELLTRMGDFQAYNNPRIYSDIYGRADHKRIGPYSYGGKEGIHGVMPRHLSSPVADKLYDASKQSTQDIKALHEGKKYEQLDPIIIEGLKEDYYRDDSHKEQFEDIKAEYMYKKGGVARKNYFHGGILDINESEEIISDDGNDIELTDYNAAFDEPTGVKSLFQAKDGGRIGYANGPPGGGETSLGSGAAHSGGASDRGPRDDPDRFGPTSYTGPTHSPHTDTPAQIEEQKEIDSPENLRKRANDMQAAQIYKVLKRKDLTKDQKEKQLKYMWDESKKAYKTAKDLKSAFAVHPVIGVIAALFPGNKEKKEREAEIAKLEKQIGLLEDWDLDTRHHAVDTPMQILEQRILDLTQPRTRDDTVGGDGPPEVPITIPVVMDEMGGATGQIDMFDAWSDIKQKQALRAALFADEDQAKVGEWVGDQRLLVNSGGLANLFRVKNQ